MNREWTLSPELDRAAQDKAWELFASFPMALLEDKRLAAAGLVLAEALALRWRETEEGSFYAHIDRLDEPLLDALAYDFKVDWWDETYTLEEKRRTLKDSWRIHRMLGTKAAVELAIRAIYPETNAVEWFEYGGKPYHFRLYIDLSDVMGDETRPWHVMDRVNFYKSLRSHLDDIQFTIEAKQPAELHVGGGAGLDATLGFREREDTFDFQSNLHLGGGFGVSDTLGANEQKDTFDFQGNLHLGGSFGTIDILPQPESLKPPKAATILRMGGVCTIISNP